MRSGTASFTSGTRKVNAKDSHYVVCSECLAVESSRIAAARR